MSPGEPAPILPEPAPFTCQCCGGLLTFLRDTLLPKLLWHMDEPIADSAFVTTYLVAEFARRDVKVILSGVGGDELFGGYRRYLGEHYLRYLNWMPEFGRRAAARATVRMSAPPTRARPCRYSGATHDHPAHPVSGGSPRRK